LAWNATAAAPCPEWWSGVAQRLALAAAIWWNWETGAPDKRSLVAYDHWELIHLLADQLGEMESVTRVDVPGRPSLLLFEVRRRGLGRCWCLGAARPFHGEDEPPVAFDWPWPGPGAAAATPSGGAVDCC
jgi:hypothetical protein